MKKELITNNDPKSPVSEIFRSLRTNMQYMKKDSKKQTIVITSTSQGEGKTWVTVNLACAFAQVGKKVLLIDADMRIPRVHTIFEVEQYPGLSNYLSGVTQSGKNEDYNIGDVTKYTDVKNLYFIPAGNVPPNPSELLASSKLQQLIADAKEEYDVILFDCSPCLVVTDATIISRLVDSTIIVVAKDKTKIDDLKEAQKRIEAVGGHIAGVVLNKAKVGSKKYESKYYYAKDEGSYNRSSNSISVKRKNSRKIEEEKISESINKKNKSKLDKNMEKMSNKIVDGILADEKVLSDEEDYSKKEKTNSKAKENNESTENSAENENIDDLSVFDEIKKAINKFNDDGTSDK